ncbi:hypothetical protein LOTGIDRAFT_228859, partial [Lottia gigantea]
MAEAVRPESSQSKAKTKSKVKVKKVKEYEEKEKIKKELSKNSVEGLINSNKTQEISQLENKAEELSYEDTPGFDTKSAGPISNQNEDTNLVPLSTIEMSADAVTVPEDHSEFPDNAVGDGVVTLHTNVVPLDGSEEKTLESVPETKIPDEIFSNKEILVQDSDTCDVEPVDQLSGFVTAPQTSEALSEVTLSGEIPSDRESNYQEIHYNPLTLAESNVFRLPEEAAVLNTSEKSIYPDLSHLCEDGMSTKDNVLSTVTENVELRVTGLENNTGTAESTSTVIDSSAPDSGVQAVEYSVNTVVTNDTIVITGEITNEASGLLVTDEPIVSGITKTSYRTVTAVEDSDLVPAVATISDSANIASPKVNIAQMTENQNMVVISPEQISAAIKLHCNQNITSLSERYNEDVSSHLETDTALVKPLESLVHEMAHSSIDSDDLTGQFEVINQPKIESESIFTEPQHVSLEDVPSEDYTSFLPDEQCMFPQSSVQSKPVSEQTRRVHIVKEAICDRFKPMTFEQLQLLYYNPQLVQSTAFIDQFIVSEGKKENHEFHEILWNYFRARKNLLNAEEEIKLLQHKYSQLQEEMWLIQPQSITAQGQCGDKAKVSKVHVYEKCELNGDSLKKMKEILDNTRDNIVNKISLYAYSSQLSRLQVESYIYSLYQSCPVIRDLPKNTPVQANLKQRSEYLHQVNRLKDCISVLFGFHRRPCRDEEFKQNIRKWTETMVGSLLRLATFEDHCFILNHILRCPGGIGQWASKLIQIPPPVTTVEGIFGSPLLDHVVVCLATVLLHPRAREEFMGHMKLSVNPDSLNQDATWILVDSDGEEFSKYRVRADSFGKYRVRAGSFGKFLVRTDSFSKYRVRADSFSKYRVRAGSFGMFLVRTYSFSKYRVRADSFGSVQYSIHETNESVLLKIFAFTTCWIDLLGRGLQTYCMSRYRQLNKRIGKMIRETVALVSDHWYNYKTLILQPALSINRLQSEFDQFFMRATYCILAAERLGSWQFMTNMPFTCVSSDCMWQLLWILHQGQGHELDLDCIPSVEECKTYLKDCDSRNQLIDNLVNLQSSETIYLLSTFANMAESRPTTEIDFIQAITLEVFEIAYICDHTREFCSKVGRELIAVIIDKHPYTFSVILHAVQSNIKQIGTMSIFLFRELPLHNCIPTDPDLLILRQWLLNCDLHTHENQLSRLILSYFNWDIDQQNGPILPLRLHRQIALLLVEVYRKYISSRNSSWLIGEGIRQVASAVRQNATAEQKFNNWAWDLALRLKLHVNNMNMTGVISEFIPCNLDTEDWLLPVVKGIKHKNPIACYLGLLMSTRTHNVTEFVSEGLDILASLVTANQFSAVIHVLSSVCPYFLSTPAYIVDNERFIKILQSTLWADETLYKMAKSVIISDFPGSVTTQFVNMIQNDVNNKRELYQCNLMILFWVHAITKINKWYNDRNCCYVLDKIIEIGFTIEGLLPQIQDIIIVCFQKFLKESNQQGMVSSVVSWISSGVYIYQPSLLEKHTEFIYLAYLVLLVEKNYEVQSLIWPALQEELYNNQLSTVDQALRTAIAKLKLQQAPAINKLNIYRWAQQAIDTPYDHTLLPLIWQQFFLLYLGRNASERSVPQRASVGERFFSSLSYTPMLKKMRKRLSDSIELLKKDIEDSIAPPTDSDDNQPPLKIFTPQQIELKLKLSKLYSTMVLWLEEPRLHDTNLYLPSLPPQYDASRLLLLFQNIQDPWLEFVDIHEVYHNITIQGHEWKKYLICKQQRSSTISQQQPQNATERILKYLRKEDGIKPAPSLVNLYPTVPDIDITILQDKSALLHLINADISIIKQHASLFSSRISRHCGADLSYIDLLPSLYSNQWKQVMIPIECKSKVNPLHRCSNPAVVQVRIEEREKNELIQRQIDENRAEYKQMMIEGLLPPPQNVCIAAVHVENAITKYRVRADSFGKYRVRAGSFGKFLVRTDSFSKYRVRADSFSKYRVRAGSFGMFLVRTYSFSKYRVRADSFGKYRVRAGSFGKFLVRTDSFSKCHVRADSFSMYHVRADSFGSVQYSIHETNESVLLKIFAFTTCWIDLLGRGLQTYCMSRYRQLNKRIGKMIRMLIKLTQATTTETKVSLLFDIANTLFYHLATVITQETDFYPPTKQFFTSCIEILGQEFISRDPKQTKQLLQFCLDNSNLSNLTCQHFQPNNSLDIFVPLYERLIHVLQQQNLDLVFMLLTKFDVKMWLEKGKPARENVKRFLSVLGSALMSCGAEPEKQSKIIFDLYCGHLQLVLRADYPAYIMDVLNILLQGSSIERLHVDCWEMFLMICFTYNTQQTAEEHNYKFDLNAIQQCRDIQLSTAEVSEILNCLTRYFTESRKGTTTEICLYGLYPAWGRYVPYIAQLLSGFSRALVTKMLFNLSDIDPYQVLDVIWQQTIGVFSAWIEPIWSNNQLISPWHEGDDLVASEMVYAFKNIIQFIYNEYAEKAPAYCSSVYSLLLMYFMRSLAKPGLVAHVASTFTAELLDLNWNLLKPDLQLLETMTTVKDSSCEDCFYLIGSVLCCVEWNDIWDYHINHQPPDIACRFQSTLLLLLIQIYTSPSLLQIYIYTSPSLLQIYIPHLAYYKYIYTSPSLLQDEEKVRLLNNMEKREWNFITLSSYRQASNVFLMSSQPASVLAERSSSAARGLGLMKSAGCFCNDVENMWSGDRQAKRQMYIHTVISLLCQCTYLPDINQETYSTVIVNLLTDLEQVEQSISDWTNQQAECVELLKTIISLLNNCNPEGNWKDITITTMNEWIYSSPNSVLLIPCLKAATRNIASYNLMVTVMENCIDVIFHQESGLKDWTPVLTSFQ